MTWSNVKCLFCDHFGTGKFLYHRDEITQVWGRTMIACHGESRLRGSAAFCMNFVLLPQDGSPDEQMVLDLATELSEKFSIESLEMYDALKEVWGNANKMDYATAKRMMKVSIRVCVCVCVRERVRESERERKRERERERERVCVCVCPRLNLLPT